MTTLHLYSEVDDSDIDPRNHFVFPCRCGFCRDPPQQKPRCFQRSYLGSIFLFIFALLFYITEFITVSQRYRLQGDHLVDGSDTDFILQSIINFVACLYLIGWYLIMRSYSPSVIVLSKEMPFSVAFALFVVLVILDLLDLIYLQNHETLLDAILQIVIDTTGYGFQFLLHIHRPFVPNKDNKRHNQRRLSAPKSWVYYFTLTLAIFQTLYLVLQLFFTARILYVGIVSQLQTTFTRRYLYYIIEDCLVILLAQLSVQKFRHLLERPDDFTILSFRFLHLDAMRQYCIRLLHRHVNISTESQLKDPELGLALRLFDLLRAIDIATNSQPIGLKTMSRRFQLDLISFLSFHLPPQHHGSRFHQIVLQRFDLQTSDS